MEPKKKEVLPAVTEAVNAEIIPNEPAKKFHTFKYWADVVKWVINFVGDCIDSIKDNPFPKKDDYTN